MRRITLLFTVAALMVMMVALSAVPAFAATGVTVTKTPSSVSLLSADTSLTQTRSDAFYTVFAKTYPVDPISPVSISTSTVPLSSSCVDDPSGTLCPTGTELSVQYPVDPI